MGGKKSQDVHLLSTKVYLEHTVYTPIGKEGPQNTLQTSGKEHRSDEEWLNIECCWIKHFNKQTSSSSGQQLLPWQGNVASVIGPGY